MTFTPTSHSRNYIIKEILIHRGMTIKDITFRTRQKDVVSTRREIAYWLRMRTSMSFPQIAESVGLKDHSSIMHHVHKYAQDNNLDLPPSGNRLNANFDPNVAVPSPFILKKINRPRMPNSQKPWTEEETKTLRRMMRENRSDRDISGELGRSINSIQGKALQLRKRGAPARPTGGRVTFWTDERKAHLAKMHGEKMRIPEMAEALGCTYSAIAAKLYDMDLTIARLGYVRKRPKVRVEDKPDPIERGIHQMWNMPEDERRMAFYEKFMKGWKEVIKRLDADKQAA